MKGEGEMGIVVGAETRWMTQEEFGAIAYEVMECVFGIHNRLGRFFDEKIYRARKDGDTGRVLELERRMRVYEKRLDKLPIAR